MKRSVFAGLTAMLILSTSFAAQAARYTAGFTRPTSQKPLRSRTKSNFRCRIKTATISLRVGLPKAAKRYRPIPSIIPTQHSMPVGA